MNFNMNRTWSQALALVRGNFQLLAIIAGVFLLLPALVLALVMPNAFELMALGDDAEAASAAMGEVIGPLIFYGAIAIFLQFIGYGAMVALIGDGRPTVGEAIMLGLRALPTMFAATLLFVLGYVLVAVVLSLIIAAIGAALGGAASGVLGAVLLAVLFVAVIYVMVRLSLTLPTVVLEGMRRPVLALRRCWRLTKPHAGAIFAFYALLFIAYVVISLLLLGLAGVIGAALGQGPAAALFTGLVNGLLSALVAMVMSGILVSMHHQLAGRSREELGETFE